MYRSCGGKDSSRLWTVCYQKGNLNIHVLGRNRSGEYGPFCISSSAIMIGINWSTEPTAANVSEEKVPTCDQFQTLTGGV